jgi:hypothetical protein
VYSAFVNSSLDFWKDHLVVINVDGNGYNNRLENVAAVTESDKSRRMVVRGRTNDFLKNADRSSWKKNTSRCLSVEQISLKSNKIIGSYQSIASAARETGFDEKGISGAAHKRYSQWGGFRWRFKKVKRKPRR